MSTTTRLDTRTFALALFSELLRRPGNLVFSPHSVRAVLDMAQAGARGETAREIGDMLGAHARGIRERYRAVAMANSLWAQVGMPLLPEYLREIEQEHGGEAHAVDFLADPEAVRGRINGWVEEHTGGKIRDLIPRGAFGPESRLVLASALHFMAPWLVPFLERSTSEEPFHLSDHRRVSARFMLNEVTLRHFEGDGLQMVELHYADPGFTMLILLPDRLDGIAELEVRLTPSKLASWTAGLQSRKVEIHLPKFRLSWNRSLVEDLTTLGMRRAFSPREADFSGMNGVRGPDPAAFWIGEVLHKAFIDVNEQGTEAAAATGGMLCGAGESRPLPRVLFRADHPFLFALRGGATEDLYFLGRVSDPTA